MSGEPGTTGRPKIPALFEVALQDEQLLLRAADELNDSRWGAWFGRIHRALRERKFEGRPFSRCHVDLRACDWADPLPLMGLCLALAEFEQRGGQVRVTLPALTDASAGSGRERFMKFIAREGFLALLTQATAVDFTGVKGEAPRRKVFLGEELLTDPQIHFLKDLPVPLAFERSTCLPATLVNIIHCDHSGDGPALQQMDEWCQRRLVEAIDPGIRDMVPGWAQRGVRYRLAQALRETLHNIAEHAYESEGLAIIYVRYREGALGEAPGNWERLSGFLKRERDPRRVPVMASQRAIEDFARTRTGFFEVFVLDAGKGLCSTLLRSGTLTNSDVNRAMRAVFERGLSCKTERVTQFGGLYLMRQLLEPVHDYLRARDLDAWWGTELPLRSDSGTLFGGNIHVDAEGVTHGGEAVPGLAWTMRLSWRNHTDVIGEEQPWFALAEDPAARDRLIKAYTQHGRESLPPTSVFDMRFADVAAETLAAKTIASETLLILPRPEWMKNRIQKRLDEILKSINFGIIRHIVIGDIVSEEAATYLAAIDESPRLRSLPGGISRIVLITRDLRACILVRDAHQRFRRIRPGVVSEALLTSTEGSPAQSAIQYLRVLRGHDSATLWDIAGPYAYVPGPIDWHDGLSLDGYLDFAQTLTHPICRGIYRLSLQRLAGLFPQQDCRLSPMDGLVESLVVRFNAEQQPRSLPRNGARGAVPLRIGSVQVSGHTERSSGADDVLALHFFRHANASIDGLSLLQWTPPPPPHVAGEVDGKPVLPGVYRRIGRTPVIAKDGWKAYQMPRFSPSGVSIYEQAPRDSYRAWQEPSRTVMKLGHWDNGGHHDLLTINTLLAFDTELDRISLATGGTLARYVYANLFRLFGIRLKDLRFEEVHVVERQRLAELWKAITESDEYRSLIPADFADREALLIYPSHAVTDHIVDRFLQMLNNARLVQLRPRVIPIHPVRRYRTGSTLQMSGLVLERLQEFAKSKPPVVLLDDAIVTGRTNAEFRSILQSLGFAQILSLAMVDRQRLPSASHLQGENPTQICFWRLDVPPMGSAHSCPLCLALRRAGDMKDGLSSLEHSDRMDSWRNAWASQNPATEWGDGGVHPIPLYFSRRKHKLGIRRSKDAPGTYEQIGGDAHRIEIQNSAGLIAYVSELRAITGRDDLAHHLLGNESIAAEARIQLLASQLLLFFGEFDRSMLNRMGQDLLQALWDAQQHDRHTALAALALIAQGDEILVSLVSGFLTHERLDTAKNRNMDLLLILALTRQIARKSPLPPAALERIVALDTVEEVGRLLKPSDRVDVYYRLHRETMDVSGKSHSSPLNRIRSAPTDAQLLSQPDIGNALGSVDQLLVLIERLNAHWLRPGSDGHRQFNRVTAEMRRAALQLRAALKRLSSARGAVTMVDVREMTSRILGHAEILHAALFTKIGLADLAVEEPKGQSPFLEKLIEQCEPEQITWVATPAQELREQAMRLRAAKANLSEAFVIWDCDTVESVHDILTNVRHADTRQIRSPFGRSSADMAQTTSLAWARLQLLPHAVLVEVCNHCERPLEEVVRATEASPCHSAIRRRGGEVSYASRGEGVLTTLIVLPFLHTLGTRSRGG